MHYTELNCISQFSFQRGASSPETLVKRAFELGYRALAITDECSFAGSVRAHAAAKEVGLKLIHGSEFAVGHDKVIALAKNHDGYSALCALISDARRSADKGDYKLANGALYELPSEDLVVLWRPSRYVEIDIALGQRLSQHFSHFYVALALHYVAGEPYYQAMLETAAQTQGWQVVASHEVVMAKSSDRPLQDVLTCLKHHVTIEQAGTRLYQNGQRHLLSLAQLAERYPAPYLAHTEHINALCSFSLDQLNYRYPHEVSGGIDPSKRLAQLSWEGAKQRWPKGIAPAIKAQIEHELKLIAELEYEHFFLTVHDIVRFARSRGILCQGRGSAANSVVCFCLYITEVDPSRQTMLFERFISKERREPPDIDVDFEHDRREEVIQYIYQRYGRHRAALAASVITYRPKSAIRDIGRVLGLEDEIVDALARSHSWWDKGDAINERLQELGLSLDSPRIARLVWLLPQLLGAPRHLSQHVGGFVIAEDPLHTLVPIENAAMPDRTVIQWDKDDLESLGLLKVDVLALGMLSALRRSFDLIKAWHRIELTPSTLPAEDGDTYTMLQNADAIGVFQVESRAQLNMLPRLKPACFYDLAIEVAIVRPGPIQGGMVNPYLRRREGTEPVVYPSNDLKAVLERTLGVPVFQEQVMQIAMVAAGFSPGEADQLRRAMAAWGRRGDLEQFQQRLYLGMSERGYSEEFAESIFNQIKGFGAYGFPESHAISFALLTYSSAYLKCHYPVEFCCALLNSLPMGFYSADDLIQDLIRHNKEVRPVCVLNSEWEYSLEPGTSGRYRDVALRAGLCSVNGLSYADIQPLLQRRKQAPKSLAAFVEYIGINRKAQQQLNRANAFRALSPNRHQTHWTLMGLSSHPLEESDHSGVEHIPAPSAADNLVADYQSVGYSLEHHPLALMRESLIQRGVLTVAEWKARVANNGRARLMGLIKTRQRPGSAAGVMFMTLEDETGHANIVVWPKLLEKQRRILLGAKLIEVRGKMQRHDKVLHLIAEHVTDQTDSLGQLRYKNRAFR